LSIVLAKMADSGKAPEILEKIIVGRMRKFYETVCLTEQPHVVLEGNPTVVKALSEIGVIVTQFEMQSIN
jgi:elongation factor Ts